MSTILQTLQRRSTDALPVSHQQMKSNEETSIRRRLSSLSMKIQPSIQSWSFPRSKSMDSDGISLSSTVTKWWGWGWTWVLSKKPSFSADLEMNEEERKAIGSDNKGSWRHVLYKVRSEIRRFVASDHDELPLTQTQTSTNKSRSFRSA